MPHRNRRHLIYWKSKDNPIQSFTEWQDHQYDPGYWTGGRIPPYLLGKRPNKMGYILIVEAVVILLMTVCMTLSSIQNSNLRSETDAAVIGTLVLMYGLFVLTLAAGISFLRKPEPQKRGGK